MNNKVAAQPTSQIAGLSGDEAQKSSPEHQPTRAMACQHRRFSLESPSTPSLGNADTSASSINGPPLSPGLRPRTPNRSYLSPINHSPPKRPRKRIRAKDPDETKATDSNTTSSRSSEYFRTTEMMLNSIDQPPDTGKICSHGHLPVKNHFLLSQSTETHYIFYNVFSGIRAPIAMVEDVDPAYVPGSSALYRDGTGLFEVTPPLDLLFGSCDPDRSRFAWERRIKLFKRAKVTPEDVLACRVRHKSERLNALCLLQYTGTIVAQSRPFHTWKAPFGCALSPKVLDRAMEDLGTDPESQVLLKDVIFLGGSHEDWSLNPCDKPHRHWALNSWHAEELDMESLERFEMYSRMHYGRSKTLDQLWGEHHMEDDVEEDEERPFKLEEHEGNDGGGRNGC